MKHLATALLALGIILAALPAAPAADTACPPNPSPGSTVNGNLVVSTDLPCTLAGVTVIGNVQVQTNAELHVIPNGTQGSTINGNVQVGTGASLLVISLDGHGTSTIDGNIAAEECSRVQMEPITVGGNVSIQNCTREPSGVGRGKIAGNFACNDNSIECVVVNSNVNGNVQINDNSSAIVENNMIGGNLQCQRNQTISGGGNTVDGNKQGQCAGF